MPSVKNKRSLVWFILILVVFIVPVAIFSYKTKDTQIEAPRLFGRVWVTSETQPAVLLYVTREERSRSLRGVGRMASYRSERYDRYTLNVRRLEDGLLLQTKFLGDIKERQESLSPQVMGVVSDVVWLWLDAPVALALPDLRLSCDSDRLRQVSPANAAFLPVEPKGYSALAEPRTLVMRGRDARFYTIDAASATITPITAEDLPPSNRTTRAEDRFNYLVAPGQSRIMTDPSSLLQKSFLTRTGKWFALLSDSERAGLSPWPKEDRPYGEVARAFYRTDYRMEGSHPAIDPLSVSPVGDVRLLQAGFLIRWQDAVWDVPDPSSTLVLAKSLLGTTEPWELIRLTREGEILWQTSTDLADPGEFLDAGNQVVLMGQRMARGAVSGTKNDTRERIVWVDAQTGKRQTLFVATGELEVPPELRP